MLKRIMLIGAAIAALVAVAAPAAQAVKLVDSEGTLPEGAKVTATSTNLVTVVTGVGELKCSKVTIHGEVLSNGPTTVDIKGLGEATTEGCNATITDGTVGTITLGTNHKGTATGVHFTADPLGCSLSGSLGVSFVTNTDVISVSGTLAGTGICVGGGHMNGSFTLETSGGEKAVSVVE